MIFSKIYGIILKDIKKRYAQRIRDLKNFQPNFVDIDFFLGKYDFPYFSILFLKIRLLHYAKTYILQYNYCKFFFKKKNKKKIKLKSSSQIPKRNIYSTDLRELFSSFKKSTCFQNVISIFMCFPQSEVYAISFSNETKKLVNFLLTSKIVTNFQNSYNLFLDSSDYVDFSQSIGLIT